MILTERSGRIGREQASSAEGWEFDPTRVKAMNYKIDTCHYIAQRLVRLEWGKDWLAQFQDNVAEWDIGSWWQRPDLPIGQYYKITMSVHF